MRVLFTNHHVKTNPKRTEMSNQTNLLINKSANVREPWVPF